MNIPFPFVIQGNLIEAVTIPQYLKVLPTLNQEAENLGTISELCQIPQCCLICKIIGNTITQMDAF